MHTCAHKGPSALTWGSTVGWAAKLPARVAMAPPRTRAAAGSAKTDSLTTTLPAKGAHAHTQGKVQSVCVRYVYEGQV